MTPPQGAWAEGPLSVLPVVGLPEVEAGDDLAALVLEALAAAGLGLQPWDVVVVTHKVVSKAEGAVVDLAGIVPSRRARDLAAAAHNDPRVVEVALREAVRVIRAEGPVLVCETRGGLVCANAGVDRSNAGDGRVTLLPRDPDASAARLRAAWLGHAGSWPEHTTAGPLGVVVSDTFGRPFRLGGVNVAIGVAGMPAATDHTGLSDPTGYRLRGSLIGTADEIAGAAELVMGKVDGVAAALVRGLRWVGEGSGAGELVRPAEQDVFRR